MSQFMDCWAGASGCKQGKHEHPAAAQRQQPEELKDPTSAMLVAMTHLRVPGGAGSKMRVCGGVGFIWEVRGR